MQTAMRSRRHAPDITRFQQGAPMTTSVKNPRDSAVEPSLVNLKTKLLQNDVSRLLQGRNLFSPIGSASNPIPPTDSKVYAALQQHYGTKDFLGLLKS